MHKEKKWYDRGSYTGSSMIPIPAADHIWVLTSISDFLREGCKGMDWTHLQRLQQHSLLNVTLVNTQ